MYHYATLGVALDGKKSYSPKAQQDMRFFKSHVGEATASCKQSAYRTHAGMLDASVGMEMILLVSSVRLIAGPSVQAWGPHGH